MNIIKIKPANTLIPAGVLGAIMLVCVSYDTGYQRGGYKGFGIAIDTINGLLKKQLMSDTSVTELTLVNADTIRYLISRKTVLGH